MTGDRGCIAVAIAVCLAAPGALPRTPREADDHVDRIIALAMTRGGAHSFLQRLTDSIGGRVTGTPESRATAELLVNSLRDAGFEDAHFEEYPIGSRWQRGHAVGRVVSPVSRSLAVGSYGWVPGTNGDVSAPLIDLGAPADRDLLDPC